MRSRAWGVAPGWLDAPEWGACVWVEVIQSFRLRSPPAIGRAEAHPFENPRRGSGCVSEVEFVLSREKGNSLI